MASSTKIDSLNSASSFENGSLAKPPRFNPNNFSLWKSRMILFMEGIDSRYTTILLEGPHIPRRWARNTPKKPDEEETDTEEEKDMTTGRYIQKDPRRYDDEDRRLVSFDAKIRAIIALSLPDEIYHSLVNFSTAKDMWSTLCVLYEGTDEVKKSKKISLVRLYELFSHEKGESLSSYYNRFNCLLNDLKLLGRTYENEEVLCKFMDCLPEFWENICTCIKTTKDLEYMPLTVLYGILYNYEQTKLLRKSMCKDVKNSSLALVSNPRAPECIPKITYPSSESEHNSNDDSHPSEAYLSDADDEGENTSVDQITDEMAMLAGYPKKNNFSGKFKFGRKQSTSFSKSSSSDKSNEECFHCGKKGHFAAECRSKRSSISKPPVFRKSRSDHSNRSTSERNDQTSLKAIIDKADKYKALYLKEKEKNETNQKRGKGLMADTHVWADEPESENEKQCFMAKINEVDDSESIETSTALVSTVCSSSTPQVHPFDSLTQDEQKNAFDSLTIDFYNTKDAKKKANAQIKSLSSQLSICLSQLKHFDKIKNDLKDSRELNRSLNKEKTVLLKKLKREQDIVQKWNNSSKNLEQIFLDQNINGEKTGLGFDKEENCTSSKSTSSTLPSFYESDFESEDSRSVQSLDLKEELLFGTFIKAKESSSSKDTRTTVSPSLKEPLCKIINSLHIGDPSPNIKLPTCSKTKTKNTFKGKGILGSRPSFPSDKITKLNVKGHSKHTSQSNKTVFIYRKCYNCGDTFHLAKDCPKERIDRSKGDQPSSSNSKGPISKWVPTN